MQDTVVFDGELSLTFHGSAELGLTLPESGESGVFMALREPYPAYTGPTEITPSSETQTLHTTMKSLITDIVINPIPNNYGLITWNGSVITVS